MFVDTTTQLPDGTRVRVRLPQNADRERLRALHSRLGLALDDIDLARALRFDPRELTVACIVAWIDGTETLVGWGAVDLTDGTPHLLLCDELLAPGARDVLRDTLALRATGRSAA